jgi:hypothetical protein
LKVTLENCLPNKNVSILLVSSDELPSVSMLLKDPP